jgi:thiol-disulfide isomerase/thioredoxin
MDKPKIETSEISEISEISEKTPVENIVLNHLKFRDDLHIFLKNTMVETTFIKFGASWCKPCNIIAPTIKSLNEQVTKANITINYFDLDVDKCSDLYSFMKQKKMIRGIPVIMCYKKSQYNDSAFYAPCDSVTGASVTDVVNFYKRNIS